jgi:hypothetical protein
MYLAMNFQSNLKKPSVTKITLQKAFSTTSTRELIIANESGHAIAPLGYQAIGLEPEPKTTTAEAGVNLREGTKQSRMIALLQRPEGASIEDICQETGWQKHTVRGVFSNTLKKRLGLTLTSYKNEGQPRHYRIIDDKG